MRPTNEELRRWDAEQPVDLVFTRGDWEGIRQGIDVMQVPAAPEALELIFAEVVARADRPYWKTIYSLLHQIGRDDLAAKFEPYLPLYPEEVINWSVLGTWNKLREHLLAETGSRDEHAT